MIQINSGIGNLIIYYSRYTEVHKYEILDHDTRIVTSGETYLVGNAGGKIEHSGMTYDFKPNTLYTYKSYYKENDIYYLATQQLLQTWTGDEIVEGFTVYVEDNDKNTFKVYGK